MSGRRGRPIPERIREGSLVVADTGCWEWQGYLAHDSGYPRITIGRISYRAHRISYEAFVAPIPDGLTIDHLCRNIVCVNPEHLEAVTVTENIRRSNAPNAVNARKTHCKYGHEFTPENIRINVVNGGRQCRKCEKRISALRREQRAEARLAAQARTTT
jgi:hypothetical protein